MADNRIMLKNVRLSFPALFEPSSFGEGDPKYQATLLIDKEDKANVQKIQKAISLAEEEGLSKKFDGKKPPKYKNPPLRDGDDEKDTEESPEFEGVFFLSARNKRAPQVVDHKVQPILDQDEIYPGCYVNVSLTPFAYNYQGTKGIGWSLGNVQKAKDGERLGGGGVKAENEFDEFETESDDSEDLL